MCQVTRSMPRWSRILIATANRYARPVSKPIAKAGDLVVGLDTHLILVPSPGGPVPTPLPHPFSGALQQELSDCVFVANMPVAVVGSVALNLPPHMPMGGPFQSPPSNKATVSQGSTVVFVGNKGIARAADPAMCCNDPVEQETGHIIAAGVVLAG